MLTNERVMIGSVMRAWMATVATVVAAEVLTRMKIFLAHSVIFLAKWVVALSSHFLAIVVVVNAVRKVNVVPI